MFNEKFIIKNSKHISTLSDDLNNSGIYFLIYREQIVYVGITTNLTRRMINHKKDDAYVFERYFYHFSSERTHMFSMMEKLYIDFFMPIYNIKENKLYKEIHFKRICEEKIGSLTYMSRVFDISIDDLEKYLVKRKYFNKNHLSRLWPVILGQKIIVDEKVVDNPLKRTTWVDSIIEYESA